jgi:hypothetical protein
MCLLYVRASLFVSREWDTFPFVLLSASLTLSLFPTSKIMVSNLSAQKDGQIWDGPRRVLGAEGQYLQKETWKLAKN